MKVVDGENEQWLFPTCFDYLLKSQLSHGGWASYASPVDGILNTMAAILALRKHAVQPDQVTEPSRDSIETRVVEALSHLRCLLDTWNVAATLHVGYEILVLAMIDLLEAEGIAIHFAQEEALMTVRADIMSKMDLDNLYEAKQMATLHSLEAFIGRVDFERLSHHKAYGSMMGSPSSTAAYLMYNLH